MARTNALAVAVELATRQRDEARRVLQDALGAQQAAQEQLQVLHNYAQETENRWGVRAEVQRAPEVLFHHYQFMGRLQHAAGLQSGVVGDHAARVDHARHKCLEAEVRLASLQKLLDKRRLEAEQAHWRREQKQTDERAAQQHLRTHSGH